MCDKTCDAIEGTIEHMTGQTHMSEAQCPTCGADEAVIRVRGNAFSAVCTGCGRADVTPLLTGADLLATEGETFEAELFELEAVRSGQATPLSIVESIAKARELVELQTYEPDLHVELRLPVPPR